MLEKLGTKQNKKGWLILKKILNNKLLKKIFSIEIAIVAVLIGILIYVKTFVFPLKHFDIIKEEAAKNNIDPYLVLAVIKTESGFNKNVTSPKHAKGLMQIMDSTAEDINQELSLNIDGDNIYDENVNISLGCKYLSSLIKKYNGNYYLAIIAYNAGMGNVDNWIRDGIVSTDLNDSVNNNIPYKETNIYLKKVINYYKIYRKLY